MAMGDIAFNLLVFFVILAQSAGRQPLAVDSG